MGMHCVGEKPMTYMYTFMFPCRKSSQFPSISLELGITWLEEGMSSKCCCCCYFSSLGFWSRSSCCSPGWLGTVSHSSHLSAPVSQAQRFQATATTPHLILRKLFWQQLSETKLRQSWRLIDFIERRTELFWVRGLFPNMLGKIHTGTELQVWRLSTAEGCELLCLSWTCSWWLHPGLWSCFSMPYRVCQEGTHAGAQGLPGAWMSASWPNVYSLRHTECVREVAFSPLRTENPQTDREQKAARVWCGSVVWGVFLFLFFSHVASKSRDWERPSLMSKIDPTNKSTSYPKGTSLKPQILSAALSGRGADTGCFCVRHWL
jgi:hypothetical protein